MNEALQRPGSAILLVAASCGALIGELTYSWVRLEMVWAASAVIASAAGTAISFVWGARKHADDQLSSLADQLSMTELRNVEYMVAEIHRRVLVLAILLIVCVALALLPWASERLVGDSWHWMYLVAGSCLGVSAFALLVGLGWRHQVDFATRTRRLEAVEERRRADLLSSLARSLRDVDETTGWARQPPRELNGGA